SQRTRSPRERRRAGCGRRPDDEPRRIHCRHGPARQPELPAGRRDSRQRRRSNAALRRCVEPHLQRPPPPSRRVRPMAQTGRPSCPLHQPPGVRGRSESARPRAVLSPRDTERGPMSSANLLCDADAGKDLSATGHAFTDGDVEAVKAASRAARRFDTVATIVQPLGLHETPVPSPFQLVLSPSCQLSWAKPKLCRGQRSCSIRAGDGRLLEAAAEAKEKLPPDKSMMLRAYYAAGLSAKSRGDDRKAAAHFTESAALADKSRDPREWVIINYSLASAHRSCGNYKESEVLCRQIVPLCTKEHGAEHQLTLGSRYGLANVFLEQGMHPGGVPEP